MMSNREIERLKIQTNGRASLFRKLTARYGRDILDPVTGHTSNQIRDKPAKADLPRSLWQKISTRFE